MSNIPQIFPQAFFNNPFNGFVFDTGDLNNYLSGTYLDNYSFYQNTFMPYSFMKLTKKNKFIVHKVKGSPLLLQKYTTCAYENAGLVNSTKTELVPDEAYMHMKWCDDEFLDSQFDHLRQFSGAGEVTLDPNGQRVLNTWVNEIINNHILAYMLNLTVGGFHSSPAFDAGASLEERVLFSKTTIATNGWVKLAKDYAAANGAAWMDKPEGDVAAYVGGSRTAQGYSGTVTNVIAELIAEGPTALKTLCNEGGNIGGTGLGQPIIIASSAWYDAAVAEEIANSDIASTNARKIVWREFPGGNAAFPMRVLYYRGRIPILPISHVSGLDQYLTGTTDVLAITAAGNIQMGISFEDNPNQATIGGNAPGILIEKNTTTFNGPLNQWALTSHGLLKAAISDPDLFTAMINYYTP